MDTQNTPIHLRLWHCGFWFLTFASMMLSMAATIVQPIVPLWMVQESQLRPFDAAVVILSFCVGLWLFGSMNSYLTQRFRRHHVFQVAVFMTQLCLLILYLIVNYLPTYITTLLPVLSLCYGACWGLAQIVLCSTLIIDVCESFQRTEANHATAWFRRFSLSLGPVIGLVLYFYFGFTSVLIASALASCLAIVFVGLVAFPFKAPDDNLRLFSCDRFLLYNGHLLIFTLLLIAAVFGLLIATVTNPYFFSVLMVGFLLALIAEKIAFANAHIESENITGLLALGTALLLMITRDVAIIHHIVPVLIGFGFGIIASRFMLFFIKMSHHCQRGTSQSTYMLTCTTGICFGIAGGYILLQGYSPLMIQYVALSLTIISLLLYHFITHPWYMKNKNR